MAQPQSEYQLDTAVVLLIFNRPDTTALVFDRVAKARPNRLLVVADGPRPDHPDDAKLCEAARAVVERVDWDCEVSLNYAQTNQGLRHRVASGLSWAFGLVEEAVILEDDCVPDPSFFRFCCELLAKYRNDKRIMMISGDNFQRGRRRTSHSYYFSRYSHCWGWATWKRAWALYDDAMDDWPAIRSGKQLYGMLDESVAVRYWTRIFDRTHAGEFNSWAYRWTYSCWHNSGLTILPEVNLVSNVGYGDSATNTRKRTQSMALTAHSLSFPQDHPWYVMRHVEADRFTQRHHFQGTPVQRIKREIVRMKRRF